MALQPVTPDELAALRLRLCRGDHQVDPATARRLMDEIERLRGELEEARGPSGIRTETNARAYPVGSENPNP